MNQMGRVQADYSSYSFLGIIARTMFSTSALNGMLAFAHLIPHAEAASVAKKITSLAWLIYNPRNSAIKCNLERVPPEYKSWDQLDTPDQIKHLFITSLAHLAAALVANEIHKYTLLDIDH